jgi:GR25 family glycosyltransferase involved in LPS biosynthesis
MVLVQEHPCPYSDTCVTCNGGTSLYNWSGVFDKAYCISLQGREDRLISSAQQFHNIGLCKYVTYYRPTRDNSQHVARPTTRGCWESHRDVMTKGKQAGAEKLLIFEDDVIFEKNRVNQKVITTIAKFLNKKKWDMFYLGHFSYFAAPTTTYKINRIVAAMLHAYIIRTSSTFCNWLIDTPHDTMIGNRQLGLFANIIAGGVHPPGIDIYAALKTRAYAIFPQIAWQSGSETSNPKHGTFFKGAAQNFVLKYPKQTQTFSEYCSYTGFYLMIVLICVIIAVSAKKFTK